MTARVLSDADAPDERTIVARQFRGLIRTRIVTGLVTVLPILITLWVVRVIFTSMRDASRWAVEAILLSGHGASLLGALGLADATSPSAMLEPIPAWLSWIISLASVGLTMLLLYLVGGLAANVMGRRLMDLIDTLVGRLPVVKSVYRASKQVLSALGGDKTQSYLGVALARFPTDSMRAIGFVTSRFKDATNGEELATIFIPSTPNPTTGFMEVVRQSELVDLDWSVEDTLATVMSGGSLRPGNVTMENLAPVSGRKAAS